MRARRSCTTPGRSPYTSYFGASVGAFGALYRAHGYAPVYCESTGINCFGVRADLLPRGLAPLLHEEFVYRPARYSSSFCGTHMRDPLRAERGFVDVRAAAAAADEAPVPPWGNFTSLEGGLPTSAAPTRESTP